MLQKSFLNLLTLCCLGILVSCSSQKPRSAPAFPKHSTWLNSTAEAVAQQRQGKVMLLEFFTANCTGCIKLLPAISRLLQHYPKRLLVVGVYTPLNANGQKLVTLQRFINAYHIAYPVIFDSDRMILNDYHVKGWPTLVIVDAHNQICKYIYGVQDYQYIKQEIEHANSNK